MKRAVIILGAGAAKAWDALLTPELTDLIRKDKSFLTIHKVPLGEFIFDNLKEFYGGRSAGINFETIINTLESILNYFMNKTVIGGSPNFVGSYSKWFETNGLVSEMMNYKFILCVRYDEEYGNIRNLANGEEYPYYPLSRAEVAYISNALKHYLSIIRDKIFDYSLNAETTNTYHDLNFKTKEFLLYLLDAQYLPRIYTTNYDRLFPNLFELETKLDFFDGFDISCGKDSFGEIFKANIPKILNERNCITYYCLHGSIYWNYRTNSDADYEFFCSPKEPHTTTFYNTAEYTNLGDSTSIFNIVTGYNKLQRISIEPLNSFHSVFAQDCINAEIIITIGYSFSDFHINRPIKNALQHNNAKLLHISFGDSSFKTGVEFRYIQSEILVMKDDFRNGKVDDKWIASTTGKQMVFYKGFKDFLENSEWKNSNIVF